MKKFLIFAIVLLTLAGCTQKAPKGERIIFTDSLTQNEVWQVSQGDSMSLMPYFEVQGFTYDDKYAVFKSKREGGWKLFATSIADGTVHKVSDRPANDSYSIFVTGNEVILLDEGILYCIDVESGAERVVLDANGKVDEADIRYNSSFTNDGRYTLLTGINPDKSGSIYRADLTTGQIIKVYSSPFGFSHPLINPVYPDIITFVPKPDKRAMYELSKEERARGMMIKVGETTPVPFVVSEPYYRATHETWSKDGERFFYFDKINKGALKNGSKGWEISVVSINKEGGDRTAHYLNNNFKLGHGIATTDMRYFVADVERPMQNPLFLINLSTGEAQIICWANQSQPSTANTQTEHVHPLFSRSGRYIAFTSDRNSPGTPQAFIIPVGKFIDKYEAGDYTK